MARNSYNKEDKLFNDRPDFNMALLLLTRIDNLKGMIDERLAVGDFSAAYRLLKRVFVRIAYKLKIEPENELFGETYLKHSNNIREDFRKLSNLLQQQKTLKENWFVFDDMIGDLSERLFDVLWDLNMIFPKKFKVTFEDEIKGDFE